LDVGGQTFYFALSNDPLFWDGNYFFFLITSSFKIGRKYFPLKTSRTLGWIGKTLFRAH
jgi:hypothetical protein